MAEASSSVVDLMAFNIKAVILAALQHVKTHQTESSQVRFLHSECCQEPSHMARQSLEEGWQDAKTVSFINTGIKHAVIVMANVGARAVHARIRILRAQALSIRTSTHGQGLAALTKDIPISRTGLFGGDLSKAVGKADSVSLIGFGGQLCSV